MTSPANDENASATAKLDPPRLVRTAFWLYLACAALSIVSLIVTLSTVSVFTSALRHQLNVQHQQVTDGQLNAVVGLTLVIDAIFAVVWIVVFALFARYLARGARWARIVLTIASIWSIINFGQGYGAGVVQVFAALTAAVLMWLPPSSAFFASVHGVRRTGSSR